MVGGALTVASGDYAAEKFLDAKRKKWEYLQKSNYNENRSAIGHAIG